MIRNHLYRGIILHQKNEYPSRHEAIVSQKVWEKANSVLNESTTDIPEVRRTNRHEMLLKGLLRCGHCGKHLIPKPAGKKDKDGKPYVYYTCGDLNKHGKSNNCTLRNIPGRAFEEFILKLLKELGQHPDVIQVTTAAAQKENKRAVQPYEVKLKEISKELDDASQEVKSLIDLAKKPDMKNLSNDFMQEANELGKRKATFKSRNRRFKWKSTIEEISSPMKT